MAFTTYNVDHHPDHMGEKEVALHRIHALAMSTIGSSDNKDARFTIALQMIGTLTDWALNERHIPDPPFVTKSYMYSQRK